MLLNEKIISDMIEISKNNTTFRSHTLIHDSSEDDIQTIAFCIQPETLIDVHRHREGSETIICLKGEIAVTFIKNEQLESIVLNQSNPILNFDPTNWHTYTSLKEDTVGVEIKEGPYRIENFIRHEEFNEEQKRVELNEIIIQEIRCI